MLFTIAAVFLQWKYYDRVLIWKYLWERFFQSNEHARTAIDNMVVQVKNIASSNVLVLAYLDWLVVYGLWSVYELGKQRSWLRKSRLLYVWPSQSEGEMFNEFCKAFHFKKKPEVRQVDSDISPCSCTWRRPVVPIPSSHAMAPIEPDEFKVILAHEFAHMKF